jgi:hypothetical protein
MHQTLNRRGNPSCKARPPMWREHVVGIGSSKRIATARVWQESDVGPLLLLRLHMRPQ